MIFQKQFHSAYTTMNQREEKKAENLTAKDPSKKNRTRGRDLNQEQIVSEFIVYIRHVSNVFYYFFVQFLTDQYRKYEHKLMKQYKRTINDVKLNSDSTQPLEKGLHNYSKSKFFDNVYSGTLQNTSFNRTEQMLFTNLPIMNKQFQERTISHMAQRNLSLNP